MNLCQLQLGRDILERLLWKINYWSNWLAISVLNRALNVQWWELMKSFEILLISILFFNAQKARMARIRIAKATSGAAFVNKKKATEARLAAVEAGQEIDEGPEDIFELQHHHLLRCLEKTTVSTILIVKFSYIWMQIRIQFFWLYFLFPFCSTHRTVNLLSLITHLMDSISHHHFRPSLHYYRK